MKFYVIVKYEWNRCRDDYYPTCKKNDLFVTTDEEKAKKFVEEYKKPTLKSKKLSEWEHEFYLDIQELDDIQEGNPWEDVEKEDAETLAEEEEQLREYEKKDKNALQVLTNVKELLDPFHLEGMNSLSEIPYEEIYRTLLSAGIKSHITNKDNDYFVHENDNGEIVGDVSPRERGERFDYSPIIINVASSYSWHYSYSFGGRWDIDQDIERINRSLSEY